MLDFLTKMLLDNKNSTKMLKKCLSKFSFLNPKLEQNKQNSVLEAGHFQFLKNIFLERYINYYVKLYHYTRIIIHNKSTKINYLPDLLIGKAGYREKTASKTRF